MIKNPIIRGFNPDPSIVRVDDDYYIVTSTFEWLPGIPVHHSRDLVNWELIGHVLPNGENLTTLGMFDSAGIWAPSLSYADGQFWLIYTEVRNRLTTFKDVHNFLITPPSILGPWSKPTFLNSSGFDPSLFRDDDGRKYLVNQQWDFRKGHPRFAGIVLQEYDHAAKQLTGPITKVLTKNVLIEGPNLYKHDGMYYLMLAEGGTGTNHGKSMARSRNVAGPYEVDPLVPFMTSRDDESYPLQKAGHGELVQTRSGEWYMAHLASRPQGEHRRCMMGRETCLQQVEWSADGWLRLVGGSTKPALVVSAPTSLATAPVAARPTRDDFESPRLSLHWSSLRVTANEAWASLAARPGYLRLTGRESFHSLYEQSLLAQRLQEPNAVAETCVEFEPETFMQMAGLICYYDVRTHYYLRITHLEGVGKVVGIVLTDDGAYDEIESSQLVVEGWPRVYLRATIADTKLQFAVSPDGEMWTDTGPELDVSKLSDDYGQGLHFTGAFIGVCVQDVGGTRRTADFDYFSLEMSEAVI